METRNHYNLGKYLAAKSEYPLTKMERAAFIFGNIFPDINIFSYFRGHTFDSTYQLFCRRVAYLKGHKRLGAYGMFQLGVATHYLADYFTTPHNSNFLGGLRAHLRYEKGLRPIFRRHLKGHHTGTLTAYISDTPDRFAGFVKRVHSQYMGKRRSFDHDCGYIIKMCGHLFGSLCPARKTAGRA